MRIINLSAFVALVLVFSSCKKELSDNAAKVPSANAILAPDVKANTMSVKVNGNSLSGGIEAIIAENSNHLVINTSDAIGDDMSLILPADIKPGTYDLKYLGDYMATYDKGEETSLVSESGSVTILERDDASKLIRGTFQFNAESVDGSAKANISEGAFVANYIK